MNKRVDFISGIVIVCLAAGVWYQASLLPPAASGIGAGGFPKFVAVCLAILGAALSIQAATSRRKTGEGEEKSMLPERKELLYAAVLAGIFFVYIMVVKPLGYLVSTMVAFPAFMFVYGERRWPRMLVISVVFSVVTFYLFEKVFYVFLPHGSIF